MLQSKRNDDDGKSSMIKTRPSRQGTRTKPVPKTARPIHGENEKWGEGVKRKTGKPTYSDPSKAYKTLFIQRKNVGDKGERTSRQQ
jgi:hypothetical protein